MSKVIILPDEKITQRIFLIRGKKIILDFDLAELYGVETKQLRRQVKRNISRFPADFMIELTENELTNLRSQFGTSSWGGLRYSPMGFTEQGIAMLSSVLNSEQAIAVNIQIIRVFTRLREMLLTHKDILVKLEQLEKKFLKQDEHNKKIEGEIQMIFQALKRLLDSPTPVRKRIGYKTARSK